MQSEKCPECARPLSELGQVIPLKTTFKRPTTDADKESERIKIENERMRAEIAEIEKDTAQKRTRLEANAKKQEKLVGMFSEESMVGLLIDCRVVWYRAVGRAGTSSTMSVEGPSPKCRAGQ